MEGNFVIKIQARLSWAVRETPSGYLVAKCEPLGLASQGKDKLDLWLNIQESIQLVLNHLLQKGELEAFLRARGWESTPLPRGATDGPVPFDVPVELLMQQAR